MLVLEVQVNGGPVVLAGSPQMSVLSTIIMAAGKLGAESAGTNRDPGDEGIDLRVGGMTAPSDRSLQEHVDWVIRDLVVGDQILVRVTESDQADQPQSRRPMGTRESQEQELFEHAREAYFRLRAKYEKPDGSH